MTRWLAGPMLVIACFLGAVPVLAQPSPQHREASRSRVHVAIAATPREAEAIAQVVGEWLDRLPVRVEVERIRRVTADAVLTPPPEARRTLAHVWIDTHARDDRVTVYMVDGSWERVLMRHLPSAGGIDEVVREQIALVIDTAVESLLSGVQIGIRRERARASIIRELPSEPAPEAPPPPRDTHLFLGMAYEAQVHDATPLRIAHGPLLSLRWLRGPGPVRLGMVLGGYYRVQRMSWAQDVGVQLRTAGGLLLAAGALPLGGGALLHAAVGVSLGLVRVEPRVRMGSEFVAGQGRLEADAVGRAELGIGIPLAGVAQAELSVGVDVDPSDTVYVARHPAGDVAVFDPWGVLPWARLGLSFDLAP